MPVVEELKLQLELADAPEARVTLVGVHETVRPVDGVTDRDTVKVPAKPLRLVIVAVDVPVEPTGNVTFVGLTVTLKSGGAITFTLMVRT